MVRGKTTYQNGDDGERGTGRQVHAEIRSGWAVVSVCVLRAATETTYSRGAEDTMRLVLETRMPPARERRREEANAPCGSLCKAMQRCSELNVWEQSARRKRETFFLLTSLSACWHRAPVRSPTAGLRRCSYVDAAYRLSGSNALKDANPVTTK